MPKHSILPVALLAVSGWAEVKTYSRDHSNEKLLKSDTYAVTVEQAGMQFPTQVYMSKSNGELNGTRNQAVYGNTISWMNFSFSGSVTVRVTLIPGQRRIHSGEVRILPARRKIVPRKLDESTVEFTLTAPGQFSVEFSETAYRHGLLVFADPLETRPPPAGSDVLVCNPCTPADFSNLAGKKSIHFQDNRHDIGIFRIPPHIKRVYLAGGALVEGALHLMDPANDETLIDGRGILDGRRYFDSDPANKQHAIEAAGSVSGTTVEGITVSQAGAFFVRLLGTDNTIHRVKTVGGWIFNNDGLVGYDNTEISDCFVWANDDGIKLYRDNQVVRNVTAWHLTNGGVFQWCWSTVDAKNIRVSGVDILHGQWPGDGENQGVFNIRASEGSGKVQQDWVFEDIHIDTPVKVLFNLAPQSSHTVKNITFRNIHAQVTDDVINRVEGFNASTPLSGIRFEGLYLNGTCITEANKVSTGNFLLNNVVDATFPGCKPLALLNPSEIGIGEGPIWESVSARFWSGRFRGRFFDGLGRSRGGGQGLPPGRVR